MKTDLKKIMHRMEELYRCGLLEDGTHARIAFSPEDKKARDVFSKYFEKLSVVPRVDAAGNLIARMEGEYPDFPAIIIGSHLDTVPDGGRYDGVLGCTAGLAVMESYWESGQKPRHPLEVIVFSDEEGVRFGSGMFGSSAFAGISTKLSGSDPDIYGENREQVLLRSGISLTRIEEARRPKESVHCFLEFHIEQGARLHKKGVSVGVVTGIAGVSRREIRIIGEANHSGSTAMTDRKDALTAAASLIAGLPELVRKNGGEYTVATVGTIKVSPGSVNVIPGSCTFSLEIRDQSEELIQALIKKTENQIAELCCQRELSYEIKDLSAHPPRPMTGWVAGEIEAAAQQLGMEYLSIVSGAFHDALMMAEAFPTGMIFVPSVKGISHSCHEFTEEADILKGIEVLKKAVIQLDNLDRHIK